ncbi:hypothetical protein EVAR_101368_1, partial [Eumeta japonica]
MSLSHVEGHHVADREEAHAALVSIGTTRMSRRRWSMLTRAWWRPLAYEVAHVVDPDDSVGPVDLTEHPEPVDRQDLAAADAYTGYVEKVTVPGFEDGGPIGPGACGGGWDYSP